MLMNERASLGGGTSAGTPEELIELARRMHTSDDAWSATASPLSMLMPQSSNGPFSERKPGATLGWVGSSN